jgi:very-short-patch-repair endonuclease
LWQCDKKHEWLAPYHNIKQGSGCPCCANKIRKVKQDYDNIGKDRNIRWVDSVLPDNTMVKTLWECKKGHRWLAKYNDIHNGQGCSRCCGNIKKTIDDYRFLAEERGFKWVGEKLPKNVVTKTWWECGKGHKWEAVYHNIKTGYGCPYCKDIINGALVSKPQRKLNDMLLGDLNYKENKYIIDIAIIRNSQKIAVEYDAQYWHKGREQADYKRDKYLISKGWKILHIKSGKLLPTRKQIKKAINQLLTCKNIINVCLDDWVIS